MSPSAYITVRAVTNGKRYVVRYRIGGRITKLLHAGSFKTMKDARVRRDFIAGELAAGRDPRESLRALADKTPPKLLSSFYETWKASRVDVDERTLANYGYQWRRIEPAFGDRDPRTITYSEIQDWVNALTETTGQRGTLLTPEAIRDFLGTLKMILDFADVEPNPARHRLLRLPTSEREIPVPPTDKHVLALLDAMPRERRLLFAFLEQTGSRLGQALAWEWGDLDIDASRILSRPQSVKGRRGTRKARWVQVPEWLLAILLDEAPPDARSGFLFGWPHDVEHPQQKVGKAMRNACAVAGIPHFHPHDLRHRRISLWHGQGIPAREIGDRVGQRQIAVTLDIYTHVMPLDEVPQRAYERVLVRSR